MDRLLTSPVGMSGASARSVPLPRTSAYRTTPTASRARCLFIRASGSGRRVAETGIRSDGVPISATTWALTFAISGCEDRATGSHAAEGERADPDADIQRKGGDRMAGTWQPLANQPSFNASTMILLTDGRV